MDGLATSDVEITDGLWHTATVGKLGDTLRLIVDGIAGTEAAGPIGELRTNTPLYIGGLPGQYFTNVVRHLAVSQRRNRLQTEVCIMRLIRYTQQRDNQPKYCTHA